MTIKFLYHFDDDTEDSSASAMPLVKKSSGFPTSTSGKFNQGIQGFKDDTRLSPVAGNALFEVNTSSYTIEFWLRVGGGGGSPQNQKIFWLGMNGFTSHLGLTYNRTGPTFTLDALLTQTTSANVSIADGNYHHIAVVVNGTTDIKVYLDGNVIITKVTGQTVDAPYGSDTRFVIGAHPTVTNQHFVGALDELRIVAGAPFYTANFTPPTLQFQPAGTPAGRSLRALYKFDTSPSDELYYLREFSRNDPNLHLTGPTSELTFNTNSTYPALNKAISGFAKSAYLQTTQAPLATLQNPASDFTLQWTMKLPSAPATSHFHMIFAFGSSFTVGYSSDDQWIQISMAGQSILAPSVTNQLDDQFHRYAIVRKGTLLWFFIDGQLSMADGILELDQNASLSQFEKLTIGNSSVIAEGGSFFEGAIDEVRFVDYAIANATTYPEDDQPFTIPPLLVATKMLLHLDNDLVDSVSGLPVTTITADAPVFVAGRFESGFRGGVGSDSLPAAINLGMYLPVRGEFTIECFFQVASSPTAAIQFLISHGMEMYAIYQPGTGNLTVQVQGSGSVVVDLSAYLTGYHHLAIVRSDINTLVVYIDGVNQGSLILSASLNFGNDGRHITFGGLDDESYHSYVWEGDIDEIRYSEGARYLSDFASPTAPFGETELVALYHFNDKLTDATNANPAFVDDGIPPVYINGKFGKAVSGFGDPENPAFLFIENASLMNFGREDFTIEFFAKFEVPTDHATQQVIFAYGDNNVHDIDLVVSSEGEGTNQISLYLKIMGADSMGVYPPDTDALLDGQFHHIAIVRQGAGYAFLYIDGLAVGPTGPETYGDTIFNGDKKLALGFTTTTNDTNQYGRFNGAIEELRVSKGAIYRSPTPVVVPDAEFLPSDPPEGVAPSTPRNLALVAEDSLVTLSWDAPLTGTEPITYQAYRYGPGATEVIIDIGDTFVYQDYAVQNGTTYQYKLMASNEFGSSPLSNNISNQKYATPVALPVAPSDPSSLSTTPNGSNVNLSWSGSTGTAPITYSVLRGTSSGNYSLLTTTSSTTYTDTTAVIGVTYYYVITATNSAGSSNYSNESNLSLQQPPGGQMVQKQFLIFNPLDPENYQNLKNDGVTLDIAGNLLVIKDGGVSTDKLADGAVTNAKLAAGIDAAKIGDGSVSNANFGYLAGLNENIQSKFDTLAASLGSGTYQKPVLAALESGDALPAGTLGARYIVMDASAPQFSAIVGLQNFDIIEYNGSAYTVAYTPVHGTVAYLISEETLVRFTPANDWMYLLQVPNGAGNRLLVSDADNQISDSNVTATEAGYLSGVTSSIQGQLDGKANRTLSNLTGPTAINQSLFPDTPSGRILGNVGQAWGRVQAYRFSGSNTTISRNITVVTGSNQVTFADITTLGAGSHDIYHPTAFPNGVMLNSFAGNVATVSANALADVTAEAALITSYVIMRTENETVAGNHSGRAILRSGNAALNGNSGDVTVSTGSVSGTGVRGIVHLSGRYINANFVQIKNLGAAVDPSDAVPKAYVDGAIAGIPAVDLTPYLKHDGSVELTGTLLPASSEAFNLGSLTNKFNNIFSSQLTVDNITYNGVAAIEVQFRQLTNASGIPMLSWLNDGYVDLLGNKISGLVAPTDDFDAATKKYVDDSLANADFDAYIKKDGSVPMEAALNLGTHKITNLGAPTADTDASTKKYVDDVVAAIPPTDLTPYFKKDGSIALEDSLKFKDALNNDVAVLDLVTVPGESGGAPVREPASGEQAPNSNTSWAVSGAGALTIAWSGSIVVSNQPGSAAVTSVVGNDGNTYYRGTLFDNVFGTNRYNMYREAILNSPDTYVPQFDVAPRVVATSEAASALQTKAQVEALLAALPSTDLTPYLKHDGSVAMTGALVPSGAQDLGTTSNRFTAVNATRIELSNTQSGATDFSVSSGVNNTITSSKKDMYLIVNPDVSVPGTNDLILSLGVDSNGDQGVVQLDASAFVPVPEYLSGMPRASIGRQGNGFDSVHSMLYRSASKSKTVMISGLTGETVITVDTAEGLAIGAGVYHAALPDGVSYIASINTDNTIELEDALESDISVASLAVVTFDANLRSEDETTLNSGEIALRSGNVTSARSGDATLRSGNATSGVSGDLTLRTGNTTTGISGGVVVRSGDSSNGGDTGEVKIRSGNTTGVRGAVVLDGSFIDVSANQIKNLADPTDFQDAATKKYVDDAIVTSTVDLTPYLKHDGSVAISGNLVPNANVSYNLGSAANRFLSVHAYRFMGGSTGTTFALQDNNGSAELYVTGSDKSVILTPTGTGSVDVSSKKITNLANPVDGTDATNKNYVDTVAANYLLLAGGSMNGDIAMQGNKIIGLGAPVNANDAVRLVDLQNAQAGTDYQSNVDGVQIDNTLAPELVSGKRYIITNASSLHANFGSIAGLEDGDIVSYDGAAFVIALNVSDKPAGSLVLVGNRADDQQYEFKKTSGTWDIFYGFTANAAGIGLSLQGNVLNVNLGAGIAQLPTDEVGIDVYVAGGLFLTEDGLTDSTDSAAQLAIKLDGTSLETSASGLRVKNGGIDQFHINSSALGDGLTGGSGQVLTLNLNSTNFEFVSNQLSLKDASISGSKLDANLNQRIDASAVSVVEGIAGETLVAGESVYIKKSDSKFYKALADVIANCPDKIYVVKIGANANQGITVSDSGIQAQLLLAGVEVFDSTKALYLSNAEAGKLTHIIPTTGVLVPMGYATDTADEWTFVQGRKIIL